MTSGKTRHPIALFLMLLVALIGCAGVQQEQAVKIVEPSAPQAAVVAPSPPVPDASELARLRAGEMLLGKWRREVQGGDTIEFFDDGRVTFYSAVEKVAYPGIYRILDKDQVEIKMKNGAPLTWGLAVTKGELTLTTPTGVGMKYKRYRGK